MGRNRTVPGALAALTAAICALAPAALATVAARGAGDLLPGPGRCASAIERVEGFAQASTCPAARNLQDGGALVPLPGTSQATGLRLAQSGLAQSDGEPPKEASRPEETPSDQPQDAEAPGATKTDRPFEGNSRPASPDLTVTEERALISSGWE